MCDAEILSSLIKKISLFPYDILFSTANLSSSSSEIYETMILFIFKTSEYFDAFGAL